MSTLAPPTDRLPMYTADTRAASMPSGFRERRPVCERCWYPAFWCACVLRELSFRIDPDEAEALGARERVRRWLGWWR